MVEKQYIWVHLRCNAVRSINRRHTFFPATSYFSLHFTSKIIVEY